MISVVCQLTPLLPTRFTSRDRDSISIRPKSKRFMNHSFSLPRIDSFVA
jgi:hypothetical protein